MMHIVELQRKLMEARGEIPPVSKIRMRTAAIELKENNEASQELLQAGIPAQRVAELQGLPLPVVERIQQHEAAVRKAVMTGRLESEGGYFAICKK